MNTLKCIKDCIKKYADAIDAVANNAKDEDEYNSGMASAEKAFKDEIHEIRDAYPHLLQVNYGELTEENAIQHIENIKKAASCNYTPLSKMCIPISKNNSSHDRIYGKWVEMPCFVDYREIVDSNNLTDRQERLTELNDLLLFMILSYPIKKLKITFVDLGNTLEYSYFVKNIAPVIWNNAPITTESELSDLIARLNKRMIEVTKEYGDYEQYVLEKKDILIPFEVVVVLSGERDTLNKLEKVCKNSVAAYYLDLEKWAWHKSPRTYRFYKEFNITIGNKELKEQLQKFKTELRRLGIANSHAIFHKGTPLTFKVYSPDKFDYHVVPDKIFKEESKFEKDNRGWYHQYTITSRINSLFSEELYSNLLAEGVVSFTTDNPEEVQFLQSFSDIVSIESILNEESNHFVSIESIIDEEPILLVEHTPIMSNPVLLKACVDYINSEAEKKEEAKIVTQDIDALGVTPYESLGDVIELPVGVSGKREINFRMDLVSHVHSFIIGQSGSGKSVFLHNVIGSAIMKYAPEDLELYLLDFKLGGVEFNRYQGVKHVKAMLVDNSDQQITLEILRELRERMAERGKLLRNAGVSNLSEYNKLHPDSKLPHVLLVADECHEMFKQDSSIPRNISNAISDIVIKIAKEGRSQGVHLILATQTLSGTEISNEILNNVSDHYLLKCAAVDSERMVSGSADITSELTTGQIYYHHVEEQSRFQAFFTSKEDAAKLIDLVKKKAESHQSNGEFYFNGAQLFHQQNDVFGENINKLAKAPVAYVGKTIDINQCDLAITLRKDFSENLLLIGLNDSEQLTRTTMNAMISLMAATKRAGKDMNFKVFNCLQNEDSIYAALLDKLESKGYCELIDGRKERAAVLKNLVDDIQNETAKDTMLFILGQDKFRELKMDAELESAKTESSMSLSDDFFSTSSSSSSKAKTFKQAMDIILDKGPEFGVHVIMQLEKPTNFLFDDYVSPKRVFQKFKHLVMLRSDESVAASLHLNDTIRLETLSSDEERLRAYYYAEESDTYTMFTPYVTMDINEIEKFIENK